MQTLELEDKLAEKLQQVAKQAHISSNDLIEPATLDDFIGTLKDSQTFKGEPVEIQRKMRSEWD